MIILVVIASVSGQAVVAGGGLAGMSLKGGREEARTRQVVVWKQWNRCGVVSGQVQSWFVSSHTSRLSSPTEHAQDVSAKRRRCMCWKYALSKLYACWVGHSAEQFAVIDLAIHSISWETRRELPMLWHSKDWQIESFFLILWCHALLVEWNV